MAHNIMVKVSIGKTQRRRTNRFKMNLSLEKVYIHFKDQI